MILSILIPTYNRPQLLFNAVNSCLDFDFGKVEIIVGDDSKNSNDELLGEIVLPANFTLTYLHRKVPLKQNKNVDDLIRRATGKYSLILHDDDYLLPGALNSLIAKALENNSLHCIYFGKQILVNNLNEVIVNNNLNKDYYRTDEYSGLQNNSVKMSLLQQVPSNGFLFPTQVAHVIRYRDYEEVGDACDFDFVVRLALLGDCKLFFINQNISAYRLSNESVSSSMQYNSILYKYEIIKELNIPLRHPQLYLELIAKDLNILCGYYIKKNRYKPLRELVFSRHYPIRKRFTVRGIYHLSRCLY